MTPWRQMSCLMALSLYLSLAACAAPSTPAAHTARPGLVGHQVRVGDLERKYWLYLPARVRAEYPVPLVIVLHGGGGADAAAMMDRLSFDEVADQAGFIVAYPYGVDGQWNDGRGASFRRNKDNSGVDDVAFIDAMIQAVAASYPIDRDRVYATGASNGGMMTYRLGIELGDQLAAIAPMIANIPANIANAHPRHPLPVLVMNGTEDRLVPWDGGPVMVFGKAYGDVVSTQDSVGYWLAANGLAQVQPASRWLPDTARYDGCRVQVTAYHHGGNPHDVVLYTLQGGGHAVPGSNVPQRTRLTGNKCMDIDAGEVIWAFFSRHTLSEGGGS